jgi:hypothetical protein
MGVGYPKFRGHTIMPARRLPRRRPPLATQGAATPGGFAGPCASSQSGPYNDQ